MSELTFSSEIEIRLLRAMATDEDVVQAAQVSNDGTIKEDTDIPKFINALMRQRHGSPFEHNLLVFHVEAPLFVVREWQRHRISSFNEMSGRYTEMLPKFYTPAGDRKMINNGSSMKPIMAPGSPILRTIKAEEDIKVAEAAWASYQRQLENGIVKELARTILPLNLYTKMIWSVNARSLMNFLSLRIEDHEATYLSYPQREIEMGAEQIEKEFARLMPYTHESFVRNGRVAP